MFLNGKIYINNKISVEERIKVLLHELAHFVHLKHYFNNENRAECEIIANEVALTICDNYNIRDIYTDEEIAILEKQEPKNLADTIEKVVKRMMELFG